MQKAASLVLFTAILIAATTIAALAGEDAGDCEHSSQLRDFVHGAPETPSRAWTLSAGGRLYDKWWEALNKDKPSSVHPAYPAFGKRQTGDSWRCVECHGWDYRGKDGEFGKGDRYTGIRGVGHASGWAPKRIARLLRTHPHHYTREMIPDRELMLLAAFVSQGLHDVRPIFNARTGRARGDVRRGREVFQTVCAACHGHDGKAINFGSHEDPKYVGTEARKAPYETLHRIRNSKAGTAMTGLRAFPLRDAVAVLAYAQTLPDK